MKVVETKVCVKLYRCGIHHVAIPSCSLPLASRHILQKEGEGEHHVPSDLVRRIFCKKRQRNPTVTTHAEYAALVQEGLLDQRDFDDDMESPNFAKVGRVPSQRNGGRSAPRLINRPRCMDTGIKHDGTVDAMRYEESDEDIPRDTALVHQDFLEECDNEIAVTTSRKGQPLRLGDIPGNEHAAEWVKRLRVSNTPYRKGGLKSRKSSKASCQQETTLADSSVLDSSEAKKFLSQYCSDDYMWEDTLPTVYDSDSSGTFIVPAYVRSIYFDTAQKVLVRGLQPTLRVTNYINEICELCRKDTYQHSCKILCRCTPA